MLIPSRKFINKLFRLFLLFIGSVLTVNGQLYAEELKWYIGLETGVVQQNFNNVQIPNNTGTRFSLADIVDNDPITFHRLELFYDLKDKHQLRFLYAPLGYSKKGVPTTGINFAGKTFTAGLDTIVKYQFNSYRLSYRYLFYPGVKWQWYGGGTLKIRDAEIALQQTGTSASNTNIGLVPLINLYGVYDMAQSWQLIADFDGLAASQGYAMDLGLKINYDSGNNWNLGGGVRILGGGVDNDTVYNFAQFTYSFLSLGYRF